MSGAVKAGYALGSPDAAAAIVLAHEGFGLTSEIRLQAGYFAELGYRVVVPALYWRNPPLRYSYTDPIQATAQARRLAIEAAVGDLVAAVGAAAGPTDVPVAVVGWCLGAGLSVAAAVADAPMAAVVAYYPVRVSTYAPTGRPTCPLMIHLGDDDEFVSGEDLDRITALEREPDVDYWRYGGARHAFCNSSRPELFNAQAAGLAHQRTIDFIDTAFRDRRDLSGDRSCG